MADASGLTRTTVRDGIVVEGPDALSWLQGQVTQDLDPMAAGEIRLTLVLSPQGKVDSFCRVTRVASDRFLIDVEQGFGPALAERLRRFKLRVKVALDPVRVVCEETSGRGWDSLGPPEIQSVELPPPDAPGAEGRGDEALFEADRIRAGVPRLGRELTERTIPQEAGDELVRRAVSFTKGCYTGQELVARLDSRGSNVPRQIRLLRSAAAARDSDGPAIVVPAPGAGIEIDGAEAGQLTSAAADGNGGWVALGLLKRAFLSGDEIRAVVAGEGESRLPAVLSATPALSE